MSLTTAVSDSKFRACWCGGTAFDSTASEQYVTCRSCGNAIYVGILQPTNSTPPPDINVIYADDYWERHRIARGAPSLESRARTDLQERCCYWLTHLLPYIPPPSRILELGSSHGGFLKLLQTAGFDAIGLEISPQIVDDARKRFDVQILPGTLEEHEAALGTFRAVVMMDVLEHLVDPLATLRSVMRVLDDDGILMVQMPIYEAGRPQDWQMFLPGEHTFIHTKESAKKLCAAVGLNHINFEEPLFPWHDMYFVASRSPIKRRDWSMVEQELMASSGGRVILALLDLYRIADGKTDLNTVSGRQALSLLTTAVARTLRGKLTRLTGR